MMKVKHGKSPLNNSVEFWDILIDRKAKGLRGRWLALARKFSYPKDKVPTWKDIRDFIKYEMGLDTIGYYISDYYGGKIRDLSTIELDHKQPISKEGSFGLENIAVTCRYYNQIKGNLTEKDFFRLLKLLSEMDDPKSLTKRLLASGRIYGRRRRK